MTAEFRKGDHVLIAGVTAPQTVVGSYPQRDGSVRYMTRSTHADGRETYELKVRAETMTRIDPLDVIAAMGQRLAAGGPLETLDDTALARLERAAQTEGHDND